MARVPAEVGYPTRPSCMSTYTLPYVRRRLLQVYPDMERARDCKRKRMSDPQPGITPKPVGYNPDPPRRAIPDTKSMCRAAACAPAGATHAASSFRPRGLCLSTQSWPEDASARGGAAVRAAADAPLPPAAAEPLLPPAPKNDPGPRAKVEGTGARGAADPAAAPGVAAIDGAGAPAGAGAGAIAADAAMREKSPSSSTT
eukprot:365682-Chlamydomonas_euryale.AAC.18